jgi:hypothetical protein
MVAMPVFHTMEKSFPHRGKIGRFFPHNGKSFRGFSTQWKECFHSMENILSSALSPACFPLNPDLL